MKYWLLTSEFPPDYGGGICTYCLETAQMLSSFGHDVLVITQNFGVKEPSFIKKDNYRVVQFNPNKYQASSFLGYEANLSFAFAQIVKELAAKEGAPDIIESQEYMGIAYYLLQYKWLQYPIFKELKVLLTLHAPSFVCMDYNKVSPYRLPSFWTGEMERFCIRAADMVISPSRYLVNELGSRMKTDDLQIQILKNPYKVEKYTDKTIVRNKILFFGKLVPLKGCFELISYFKQLWNEGFEYPLIMIGGGDHLYHPEGIHVITFIRKKYKEEIKNGKLILLGSIPPHQLNKFISDAHIIIIPSLVDNLPYTVAEVMGSGKVLLASMQGGQTEIIENGVDGFLFDHNDIPSFKERIRYIMSLSDNQLKEIGEKAFRKVQKEFSRELIYNKKINLIQKILSSPSKKQFPFIRPQSGVNLLPDGLTGEDELLSVVIPYYNMGQYVTEAVKSVIGSTYKKIEIIIVNDGSSGDENISILHKLSETYSVKIINKTNEGLALARNKGASLAKGRYLAFLDPDDTVEATYYEKAINVLKHYDNVYFVGCWAKYFGNASGYWPSFNPEPPYLLVHNMINSSALVFKKAAFLDGGLNDPKMIFGMEDYDSVIGMVKKGYQGVALPESLWNYRVRKKSMSRAFTTNKQLYLYGLITEKHKNFYSIFAADIINLLNANGPGFKYDNPTFPNNSLELGLIGSKVKNKIYNKLKSNKILRKLAINIKTTN